MVADTRITAAHSDDGAHLKPSKFTPPTPPPTPSQERELHPLALCVEDAAEVLGIGRTLVFRLLRDGDLKAVRIGRRTLIPVRELEAFLARLGGEVANV
jgi:excisionase family DNA binding protein